MKLTAGRVRGARTAVVGLCVSVALLLAILSGGASLHATDAGAEAPPAGAVISLPFNEGSGTVANDASGNGNTGTLQNGPTWTAGKSGSALSFDGVNDTVYIANSTSLNAVSSGVTVAAWVYRSSTQAGGVSVVSREFGNILRALLSRLRGRQVSLVREHHERVFRLFDRRAVAAGPVDTHGRHL